ncbi:substrate-binding periplasmic protein [Aestuariispira insulae]|uniref:Amino acid ABC transporter substrate-binding protein (PAAT family) n=1 Tax=Aestuariispira insulae TaxID=1461337 RepID=A0A3D9HWT8_9PROT|nr:transporter substrate-binding domain-containing protein [Aestuariispira insulae]RED53972.1 amino acid ABC transporter substrate-binding protein (PAAT family) [Aestuariispira insulae]
MKVGLFGIWLLAALAGISQARAEKVIITTGEYAPYNSPDFKHYGLMPRLISEAFRLRGIEVQFRFYPWARAYELSKHGKVNGTAHWYDSAERREDHFYSDNILDETVVWFHLKATQFDWNELEDVGKYRVGAVQGYTYNAAFYEAIEKGLLHVEFVPEDTQNYKKLLIGRIEAVPEVIDIGMYILHQNFPRETVALVTQHPKPFFQASTHLLLSRQIEDSERLIKLFNEGLAELKASGLYDDYLLESRQGLYAPAPD